MKTKIIKEFINEQEELLAAENLAGNVIKAEFHKGCLFSLRLIEDAVKEKHDPKCDWCGKGKGVRKRYLHDECYEDIMNGGGV